MTWLAGQYGDDAVRDLAADLAEAFELLARHEHRDRLELLHAWFHDTPPSRRAADTL